MRRRRGEHGHEVHDVDAGEYMARPVDALGPTRAHRIERVATRSIDPRQAENMERQAARSGQIAPALLGRKAPRYVAARFRHPTREAIESAMARASGRGER